MGGVMNENIQGSVKNVIDLIKRMGIVKFHSTAGKVFCIVYDKIIGALGDRRHILLAYSIRIIGFQSQTPPFDYITLTKL